MSRLTLSSPAFTNEGEIPEKYTCEGEDISPPLHIEGIPQGTQSIALIVEDPDAPLGTWDHWLVWNIDPATQDIPENSIPKNGITGINDFKQTGYGGPCPPFGTHRYYFHVYALDTRLDLPPGTKKTKLQKALNGHVLAEGSLMGRYAKHR
jgi:Raf kinase inhibitor-like YbhB/YbcL family protein